MDMFGWIVIGIVIVIVAISLSPNHTAFQCPKCGETFVPKRTEMLGTHTFTSYMLTCPHCGKRCMMKPAGKQK